MITQWQWRWQLVVVAARRWQCWWRSHERRWRDLAEVQPARQVLPRRGAADEEGDLREQERHVELAEHVEA